jgi:hypothetical protein
MRGHGRLQGGRANTQRQSGRAGFRPAETLRADGGCQLKARRVSSAQTLRYLVEVLDDFYLVAADPDVDLLETGFQDLLVISEKIIRLN